MKMYHYSTISQVYLAQDIQLTRRELEIEQKNIILFIIIS